MPAPTPERMVNELLERLEKARYRDFDDRNLIDIRNQAFDTYIRTEKTDFLAACISAYCSGILGQIDEGIELMKEVLQMMPESVGAPTKANVHMAISELYVRQGEHLKALEHILEQEDAWVEPNFRDLVFHVLFQNGIWTEIEKLHKKTFDPNKDSRPNIVYAYYLLRNRMFGELNSLFKKKATNHTKDLLFNLYPKKDKFPSVKSPRTVFWNKKLNQALSLLRTHKPDDFETTIDGVQYILQLDGSYIAHHTNNTEYEGQGKTKEEALQNLSTQSFDEEYGYWMTDSKITLNPEPETLGVLDGRKIIHYKPGVGLVETQQSKDKEFRLNHNLLKTW